jgi:hypothetical protein
MLFSLPLFFSLLVREVDGLVGRTWRIDGCT